MQVFWMLAVKSENLKSLPTACKNKDENVVRLADSSQMSSYFLPALVLLKLEDSCKM